MNPWLRLWLSSPNVSLLSEYLIQLIHLTIGKDLIRIYLMDIWKSNRASLSDWIVAVGQGEDVIKKGYKNLRNQRRSAETSFSGFAACLLQATGGFRTRSDLWAPFNPSRAGKLQTSAKDPSSYLWSAGFHWWHAAVVSGRFLSFQMCTCTALVLPLSVILPQSQTFWYVLSFISFKNILTNKISFFNENV